MSAEPYDTDRVLTVPNVLSFIRLAGIPIFLWLLLAREADLWAVAVLAIGGATDWLTVSWRGDGTSAPGWDRYWIRWPTGSTSWPP